jgi:hypothetical protein
MKLFGFTCWLQFIFTVSTLLAKFWVFLALAKSCAMCFAKKSKAALHGDNDWICTVCTLKNTIGQLMCAACGERKEGHVSNPVPSTSCEPEKGEKTPSNGKSVINVNEQAKRNVQKSCVNAMFVK